MSVVSRLDGIEQRNEGGPSVEDASAAGLTPQEWSAGGNRCQKPTNGKTGRCWNRARWCDTEAAARYARFGQTWTREPGSYAYKVCNRHALLMVAAAVDGIDNEGGVG